MSEVREMEAPNKGKIEAFVFGEAIHKLQNKEKMWLNDNHKWV